MKSKLGMVMLQSYKILFKDKPFTANYFSFK
jgi:hypothetical protein